MFEEISASSLVKINLRGEMKEQVTHALGGELVWPGLLRKLDRQMPGYDQ